MKQRAAGETVLQGPLSHTTAHDHSCVFTTSMLNGLSFDIEDYYQIIYRDYFDTRVEPSDEAERNTHWILDTLAAAGTRATFFMLATVATRFSSLTRRIAGEHHEIAVHGLEHSYINRLTPRSFREEITTAKKTIEDIAGTGASGHRAPAFSITRECLWAMDVLREAGFLYDSSLYPIKGKRYGMKDIPTSLYRYDNGLYELPLSCLHLLGRAVPVAGGGYIRHFPYWWTEYALRNLSRHGRPAVVYMHPYEFEPTRPTMHGFPRPASLKLRIHTFLQARNRGEKHRAKLSALLDRHDFVPLKKLIP